MWKAEISADFGEMAERRKKRREKTKFECFLLKLCENAETELENEKRKKEIRAQKRGAADRMDASL